MLDKLSIITITKNNPQAFARTKTSILPLLEKGAEWVVINGGESIENLLSIESERIVLVEERDNGVYEAINKGIDLCSGNFFVLIHSGDEFIKDIVFEMEGILKFMDFNNLDLSLNSCKIGKRNFTSRFWKPFFLHLGCQPPHPPSIYRYSFFKNLKYETKYKAISDLIFFRKVFKISRLNYKCNNRLLIQMEKGGLTSGGIKSNLLVFNESINAFGVFSALSHLIIKPFVKRIIQSI